MVKITPSQKRSFPGQHLLNTLEPRPEQRFTQLEKKSKKAQEKGHTISRDHASMPARLTNLTHLTTYSPPLDLLSHGTARETSHTCVPYNVSCTRDRDNPRWSLVDYSLQDLSSTAESMSRLEISCGPSDVFGVAQKSRLVFVHLRRWREKKPTRESDMLVLLWGRYRTVRL